MFSTGFDAVQKHWRFSPRGLDSQSLARTINKYQQVLVGASTPVTLDKTTINPL
jgi:hypothetical protein